MSFDVQLNEERSKIYQPVDKSASRAKKARRRSSVVGDKETSLIYNFDLFRREASDLLNWLREAKSKEEVRQRAVAYVNRTEREVLARHDDLSTSAGIVIRQSAVIWRNLLSRYNEDECKFSLAQALHDLAHDVERRDLSDSFYAELVHLNRGLLARTECLPESDDRTLQDLHGRQAAQYRSTELDLLWRDSQHKMDTYRHGLLPDVIQRRRRNKQRLLEILGGTDKNWANWKWHARRIIKDVDIIKQMIDLPPEVSEQIAHSRESGLPFGITPYYLSLMDKEGQHDQALRAQVLPSGKYVNTMCSYRDDLGEHFDFMREHDTSPVPLITRRYPNIVIFKPYNTCPQICVYCQRNWEINDAMDPNAMASEEQIDAAVRWIERHPAISEVLLTGGDPLVLNNRRLKAIMNRLVAIPSIERIRIGTRTPVTMPMRFTEKMCDILASYRKPGAREICVVTHVEHPYEITPEMVQAIERLRTRGISVYNQLVFTFYNSRRFEATYLRRLLRLVGIDPYYTFNTKGKEETSDFRVPIARLLQEQSEEVRLMPGLVRTDEAVFNLPVLGKNHLRAGQNHELVGILPDGSRIIKFHPWEKYLSSKAPYLGKDVPILDYLRRLEAIGEDPTDYQTIWYYY